MLTARDESASADSVRWLIVNADDFGYSRGVNRGVAEAYEQGIVTSAGLMVDRPGAEDAAAYARENPGLSVGLHAELPRRRGETLRRRLRRGGERRLRERAARDLERQVERFRLLVGAGPTHLDSHRHRHREQALRDAFIDVAKELGVPLRHFDPTVRFCGDFYGQIGAGRPNPDAVTPKALVALLEGLPAGVTELCCHPGYTEGLDEWYRNERVQEVRALCDPEVQAAIERHDIRLISFRDLQRDQPSQVVAASP